MFSLRLFSVRLFFRLLLLQELMADRHPAASSLDHLGLCSSIYCLMDMKALLSFGANQTSELHRRLWVWLIVLVKPFMKTFPVPCCVGWDGLFGMFVSKLQISETRNILQK